MSGAISTLILLTASCHLASKQQTADKNYEKGKLETRIFPVDSEKKQWGYDIYFDDGLLIHQPTIPAIAGNKGFASQKKAHKVATLVIYKLKNNML